MCCFANNVWTILILMILPDKEIFVQLIKENKGIIYKICNSYCTNEGNRDDLAQEIVYNLWKSFPNFNSEHKFSTWMYRIALNVSISFYRKEIKFRPHMEFSENLLLIEENSEINNSPENNLKLVFEFINELKEIDKSIMLLYLDDKSYKEISEITGITETNVATKINRIKEKLKLKFSNYKK